VATPKTSDSRGAHDALDLHNELVLLGAGALSLFRKLARLLEVERQTPSRTPDDAWLCAGLGVISLARTLERWLGHAALTGAAEPDAAPAEAEPASESWLR